MIRAVSLPTSHSRWAAPGFPVTGRVAFRILGALALVLACAPASAQWAWQETNGVTTFSDSPPPSEVKPGQIVQQPANPMLGAPAPSAAPPTAPAANGAAPARTAPKSVAEQDADFRKRQADRQKADQKVADDDAAQQRRATECAQARGYQKLIESGVRLMRPDAEGNRSFLDDEQRAAEAQKAQDSVARNCG